MKTEPEPAPRARFEWDEAKNRSNIKKHGFDCAEAEEMFHNALLNLSRYARGLRRGAMDWNWNDAGPGCLRGIRGTLERDDPYHLAQKGES